MTNLLQRIESTIKQNELEAVGDTLYKQQLPGPKKYSEDEVGQAIAKVNAFVEQQRDQLYFLE